MKKAFIFIIAAITALSCSDTEMYDDTMPDTVRYAEFSFKMSDPLKDSTMTRSVMDADPDEIKNICAFAFDASSGDLLRYRSNTGGKLAGDPVMTYISGSTSFEWTLPLGVEMDIYAVCNMGQINPSDNLSDFLSSPELHYEIDNVSDLNSTGVPMTAVLEGISDDNGSSTYVLPARRIISKYTIRITDMPADYEITGIRICNVNSRTTLFAINEVADASSGLIMGDWATEEDLSTLNSGGRAAFYMFENAQTTAGGVSLPSDPEWFEVHGLLKGKADLCTYLDIVSVFKGESRRDRLYLGQNCNGDFDVIRNTIRNITCPAPTSMKPGSGQDILHFTDTKEIAPGETVEIPFAYNLALSEADPSSIVFTADDDLTLGTPVFTSEGENYGTGVIPVTCSTSADIGETLSVRMVSGDASSQTGVQIVNKLISVRISTPLTLVRVRSVQLAAKAQYADGTEITDPAMFDWKITTGSHISTVKDGLLSRIGYCYGPVLVEAEFDGVRSNKLPLIFDSVLLELFSEPAEVNIGIGSSTPLELYYTISKISDMSGTEITVTETSAAVPHAITYSMNDLNIASVTKNASGTSIITGKASGTTSLDIRYRHQYMGMDYGIATLEVPVNVGGYHYYQLEVSKSSVNLSVGNGTQLEAYLVAYSNGMEVSRTNVTYTAAWSSSDSSVATVSSGSVTGISGGTATITARYGVETATVTVNVEEPDIPDPVITHELSVTAGTTVFTGGGSTAVTARYITYINGIQDSAEDVTSSASWSSDDTSVATVSGGYISINDVNGSAVITASYNGVSDSVTIIAKKKDDPAPIPVITYSLDVSPSGVTVYDKDSESFTATFHTYTDGIQTSSQNVTSSCSWSVTSGSAYVSVSGGVVTGKGGTSNGSATVKASYTYDGKTYSDTGSVEYRHEPVLTYRLDVSIAQASFTGGGTTGATATYITLEDGIEASSRDVTSSAVWSSSNTNVASVNGGNIIVNNVEGSATITATYNGRYGSGSVSNKYVEKGTLKLAWTSLDRELLVGDSTTNPALYFAEGSDSPVNVSSEAAWSSSNNGVATVSGGTITATGEGRATITATYRGLTASCTIGCVESLYVVNSNVYTVSVGTGVNRVAVDLTLSDGSIIKDAGYSWQCTASGNSSVVSKGAAGSGPVIYRTSGTTWNFTFTLTVYTPDGVNPGSVTAGTSISASGLI